MVCYMHEIYLYTVYLHVAKAYVPKYAVETHANHKSNGVNISLGFYGENTVQYLSAAMSKHRVGEE